MSLQGIPVPELQKFPGAIVADLRDYVAKLGLPSDWYKRLAATKESDELGIYWKIGYNGNPLASYSINNANQIVHSTHHISPSPKPDPLVIATEQELWQPTNSEWRRFNDCVFRISEVAAIDGKFTDAGVGKMRVIMRNGEKFQCVNEPNYANSGMNTFEWFLEHVMQLTNKRTAIAREKAS